jgi:hypothetical protein
VVCAISDSHEVPRISQEQALIAPGIAEFCLIDIRLTPSPVMTSLPDKFGWWCRKGLLRNMEKVTSE